MLLDLKIDQRVVFRKQLILHHAPAEDLADAHIPRVLVVLTAGRSCATHQPNKNDLATKPAQYLVDICDSHLLDENGKPV
jgi:hypothetical protein